MKTYTYPNNLQGRYAAWGMVQTMNFIGVKRMKMVESKYLIFLTIIYKD